MMKSLFRHELVSLNMQLIYYIISLLPPITSFLPLVEFIKPIVDVSKGIAFKLSRKEMTASPSVHIMHWLSGMFT